MRAARTLAAFVFAATSIGAVACASIAGIDDRELDPSFSPGSVATSACADYCSAIASGCAEPRRQYISDSACLAVCKALPEGTVDNPTGNTTSCRADRAVKARDTGEPAQYCSVAGPSGSDAIVPANACGTSCDAFCALTQKICPAQFTSEFAGQVAQCKAACAALPDKGAFDVGASNQTGNSLQCRLYHLQAATAAPEDHCPHVIGMAGKQPTPPCAD